MLHVMCLLGSSVVTCDKPGQVTNGRSSWSSEDRPKYGEIIQYLCNEGYTLDGKEKIVCTETGKYDSQPPECKGQSCLRNPLRFGRTASVCFCHAAAATPSAQHLNLTQFREGQRHFDYVFGLKQHRHLLQSNPRNHAGYFRKQSLIQYWEYFTLQEEQK